MRLSSHDFRHSQRNAPFLPGKGRMMKLELVGPKTSPGHLIIRGCLASADYRHVEFQEFLGELNC